MAMQTPPYIWQYLPLALQILAALGLAAGMVGASFLIGKHKNSRTKLGAYECGMDPVGDARGRFSVRFYMVAMLFILFDVEAVFMLPWAVIFRRLPGITGSRILRLLGDAGLPRLRRRRPLLRLEEGHPHLGRRQGRPLNVRSRDRAQRGITAAVLRPCPTTPPLIALAELATDAKFDRNELTITVARESIVAACEAVKAAGYNFFEDLTAVDWYPQEPRFQLSYHILSHRLKAAHPPRRPARLRRCSPSTSITSVWPSANFYEREVFDLFGIDFPGHPPSPAS